jgi:hypothetical protein
MSYNNVTFHAIRYIENIIRNNTANSGTVIGIGAHDFRISKKFLNNISTISNTDIKDHERCLSQEEFNRSSKRLTKLFFRHYGYSTYLDLDIYDRADIVFDLCKPIPENLYQKFDLVIDPTSNYVVNINQSYLNTSRLLKIGGIKVVMSSLGDHTNRYELNPSPNYLIDFHLNHGFRLEKAFLIDYSGRILPYKRYQTKVTPVATLLPFRLFLLHTMKLFFFHLYVRNFVRKAPFIDYEKQQNVKEITGMVACSQIPPAYNTRKSQIKCFVKRKLSKKQLDYIRIVLRKIARIKEVFVTKWFVSSWVAIIVLRKVEEVLHVDSYITGHYRHFDQTR